MDPQQFNAHVGRRIRSERRRRNLTQAELGEQCDVSFQNIQKYEAGRINISARTLWRLARALSMSITELLPRQDLELEAERADVPR